MSIENVNSNYAIYGFDYPAAIHQKTGLSGLMLPKRDFYLMVSRDVEKADPARAAFYREIASHYPDCDRAGYEVDRDGKGRILVDYDDWDDLSLEQKLFRGNRDSAIALLDRLRFHLEMMDDPEMVDELDELRRGLNELVDELSDF